MDPISHSPKQETNTPKKAKSKNMSGTPGSTNMPNPSKKPKKLTQVHIWQVISLVLAVAVAFLILNPVSTGDSFQKVSEKQAANEITELISATSGVPEEDVEIVSVEQEFGLYLVNFTIAGQEQAGEQFVYISQDGKFLIAQGARIEDIRAQFEAIRDLDAAPATGETEIEVGTDETEDSSGE